MVTKRLFVLMFSSVEFAWNKQMKQDRTGSVLYVDDLGKCVLQWYIE